MSNSYQLFNNNNLSYDHLYQSSQKMSKTTQTPTSSTTLSRNVKTIYSFDTFFNFFNKVERIKIPCKASWGQKKLRKVLEVPETIKMGLKNRDFRKVIDI